MSLLPQRKKSAGEIAKLRETLGIPGQAQAAEDLPVSDSASVPDGPKAGEISPVLPVFEAPTSAIVTPAVDPSALIAPLPIAPQYHPRPVRSLKRSERIPVLPVEEPGSPEAAYAISQPAAPTGQPVKIVRSLRKSEQVPLSPAVTHTPPADSNLPVHRHSDQELNQMRKQAAIAMQAPAVPFSAITAHLALLIPGYLFAIAGGVCYYFYELPISITSACVVIALIIAGFIFLKKPFSRHHAAFISVISLFVIIFGALYYFPQLRHGT
ncbi:MAG: hypothetical protein ABI600_19785 [Luteolibacter sp.]